jgi:hypothetical protein
MRTDAMLTSRRGLVIRNSIIYYGYTQALSNLPKGPTKEELQAEKWKKMMEVKPGRPDDWVSLTISCLACRGDDKRLGMQVHYVCNAIIGGRGCAFGINRIR